jgi:uncharacterized lipoprotein YajG
MKILKRILLFIVIAIALIAVFLFAACAKNNAQPSVELTGPSASLSGTPYRTAGPSSTVTINVTPLPGNTNTSATPPAGTSP